MDLVWEFEAAYGRLDPHRDSWPRFLSGVARTARFTARQLYAAIAGPSFALSALSTEGASERLQVQMMLERTAFGEKAAPAPALTRSRILGPDGEIARA
jgi:hypothetical protein